MAKPSWAWLTLAAYSLVSSSRAGGVAVPFIDLLWADGKCVRRT